MKSEIYKIEGLFVHVYINLLEQSKSTAQIELFTLPLAFTDCKHFSSKLPSTIYRTHFNVVVWNVRTDVMLGASECSFLGMGYAKPALCTHRHAACCKLRCRRFVFASSRATCDKATWNMLQTPLFPNMLQAPPLWLLAVQTLPCWQSFTFASSSACFQAMCHLPVQVPDTMVQEHTMKLFCRQCHPESKALLVVMFLSLEKLQVITSWEVQKT